LLKASDIIAGRRPVTVYLRWPEGQLKSLAPLVRLIMGTLIKGMITTHDEKQGKACRPVLVLADEAGRTKIPTLVDDAATVRSRGIVFWVSVQDLSQLEASTAYGKAGAHTLINNSDTIIYYPPNDVETAYRIERWLGRKSGFATSHQERGQGHEQTSEGKSEQAVPLMTAQAIMELEDSEILVKHRNKPPIRATRMDWRDHPELKNRRALPPIEPKPIPEPVSIPDFLEGQEPDADGETGDSLFQPVDAEKLSAWPNRRQGTIFTGAKTNTGKPGRVD
jgi:type IV secretion system protein VirD4